MKKKPKAFGFLFFALYLCYRQGDSNVKKHDQNVVWTVKNIYTCTR